MKLKFFPAPLNNYVFLLILIFLYYNLKFYFIILIFNLILEDEKQNKFQNIKSCRKNEIEKK